MAKIPFTYRELRRASEDNYKILDLAIKITNAHRLLLFYSVECGLKAVYLKRQGLDILSEGIVPANSKILSHDINHLLEELKVGKDLHLSSMFSLNDIKISGKVTTRKSESLNLNQAWRYGGQLSAPSDDEMFEKKLRQIVSWIKGELR